jgi:hypothetical protein
MAAARFPAETAVRPVRGAVRPVSADRVSADRVSADRAPGSRVPASRGLHGTEPLPDLLRPLLMVIAPSMADAVRSVGGWLFDHSIRGWDAEVLTSDRCPARPALILGARADDLKALSCPLPKERPLTIMVSAALYTAEALVRQVADDALRGRRADVLVWGDALPLELEGASRPVRHQISVAARAFKTQALLALPAEPALAKPGAAQPGAGESGAGQSDLAVEVFSQVRSGRPARADRTVRGISRI